MSFYLLENAETTERFAACIAPHLAPGDVIGLVGDLGSGKSCFCRALVSARLAACDRTEEIPSPSYTLVQTYDLGDVELWHSDLYRLGDVDELTELGLDDAFHDAICLVEWSDRLGDRRPERMLRVELAFVAGGDDMRSMRIDRFGDGWEWLGDCLSKTGLVAA